MPPTFPPSRAFDNPNIWWEWIHSKASDADLTNVADDVVTLESAMIERVDEIEDLDNTKAEQADMVTAQADIATTTAVASRADTRVFDVRKYGTIDPTGVTDCSAAWQAAIDAAEAVNGGEVTGPPGVYKVNLVLKHGVIIRGPGRQYITGTVRGITFITGDGDIVIDTPATQIRSCGLDGINIEGRTTGACVGIRFRSVVKGFIKNVTVNITADEGILLNSACGACVLEDVQVINAVRNRTRAAVTGGVDISGTDHDVRNVESTTSMSVEGTISDANLRCVAFRLNSTNAYYRALMGEISDVGIVLVGGLNRLSDCRADLNYAHGWHITGTRNLISNGLSLNNARAATNTYDGYLIATGGQNRLINCDAVITTGNVYRYGYNDSVSNASPWARNKYAQCEVASTAVGTATWNISSSFAGAAPLFSPSQIRPTANLTTVDVRDARIVDLTTYTAATTVTDFTNGVNGQYIFVIGDADVTLQHAGGGNIRTNTGANLALAANRAYGFVFMSSVWYQL